MYSKRHLTVCPSPILALHADWWASEAYLLQLNLEYSYTGGESLPILYQGYVELVSVGDSSLSISSRLFSMLDRVLGEYTETSKDSNLNSIDFAYCKG